MPDTLASFLLAAGHKDDLPDWMHKVVMPLKPLPHQIETLGKGIQWRHFGDYSEPGCMKTLTAQALVLRNWAVHGKKAIYMTKPTLVEQVLASFKYNYPDTPATIEAFNGEVDERIALVDRWNREGWPDVLVMSDKMFVGVNGRGKKVLEFEDGPAVDYRTFIRKGYEFLVSDDVVGIKTTSSKIHQAVKEFTDTEANSLWVMNGTPVENTPPDAYGFIHLIAEWLYRSRKAFDRQHLVWGPKKEFGRDVIGYRNLDVLQNNLYRFGIRFTKRDVLDIPPVTYVDVPVVLSKQHKALYDKVINEMLLEFEDGTMLDFTSTQKMYQVSQQMLVNAEAVTRTPVPDNRMLVTLKDLVESLEGRKVMVGCWYNETVRTVADRLCKLNPAMIYGKNTDKEREEAKHRFINDPDCKVAVTNYLSGGVGIDGFQKVCSHAIALEMVTVPGYADQWVSRINRGGQENPMTVYMMVPRRTVAVKLKANLLKKEGEANEVIGDKKQLMRDLLGEE